MRRARQLWRPWRVACGHCARAPLAFAATACALGLALGAAIFCLLGARIAREKAATLDAPDVVAYLEVGLSAADRHALRSAAIRETRPARIAYVSPAEALDRLARALGPQPADLALDDGGLALVPASLEITLGDDAALSPAQAAEKLSLISGIDEVEVVGAWARAARDTLARLELAAWVGAVVAGAVFLALAYAGCQRRAKALRGEAAVWSLLGAGESFVRAPLVASGAIHGLMAAALAAAMGGVVLARWPRLFDLAPHAGAMILAGVWIAAGLLGAIVALCATPRGVTGWMQ